MKNKYTLHLATSYLQILISILIPIFLTPYMTKHLGSEVYGLWILLNSIILYFGLSSLGFGTTLLRDISHTDNFEKISRYVTTMLVFFLFMSIVVTLIFIVVWVNFDSLFIVSEHIIAMAKVTFFIVYTLFIVNFIMGIFNTLLFAKGLLHIQNMMNIIKSLIVASLIFFVLYYGYSIIEIALVQLCMAVLFSLFIFYIVKKRIKFEISKKYFDLDVLRHMVKPSLHYFLITFAAMIVQYSDNIVISSFIGLSAVAVYSIGYKLIDISQKLLFKLVDIMIPDIAKMYKNAEYTKILKLHNKMIAISTLLAFFGYGILFYWGVDIITLWVGEEFTIEQNVFNIFILFGLWHTWVHVSAIFIVAMGIHRETSYMGMLDAGLNIIISIILLKDYGLYGVAMGTLIAHLLTNGWFTNYWFYKNIRLKISESKIESNE